MSDKDPRIVVGEARVRAALGHVQQAQVELSRAMSDLSDVIGYVPEGNKLSRLYDQVRAVWYKIDERLKMGPSKRYPDSNKLDRDVGIEEASDPHDRGCGHSMWQSNFYSPFKVRK